MGEARDVGGLVLVLFPGKLERTGKASQRRMGILAAVLSSHFLKSVSLPRVCDHPPPTIPITHVLSQGLLWTD